MARTVLNHSIPLASAPSDKASPKSFVTRPRCLSGQGFDSRRGDVLGVASMARGASALRLHENEKRVLESMPRPKALAQARTDTWENAP